MREHSACFTEVIPELVCLVHAVVGQNGVANACVKPGDIVDLEDCQKSYGSLMVKMLTVSAWRIRKSLM
jgi:hypothetical protein